MLYIGYDVALRTRPFCANHSFFNTFRDDANFEEPWCSGIIIALGAIGHEFDSRWFPFGFFVIV